MIKKILLGLVAVVAMAGGVAAMSAYEAHVINVTAHIENALSVDPQEIEFGTVFPQEYLEKKFTISLSDSFLSEGQLRKGDVTYKIVQKPKCVSLIGEYAPVNYWDDQCPEGYTEMPNLCQFLSKIPVNIETGDVGVPSYFVDLGVESYCVKPSLDTASGYLNKCHPDDPTCGPGDLTDCWTVDLKVPPVEGYIGQDWPLSCADYIVPVDGADYGCDLWIEVTGLSDLPEPESY